MPESSGSISWDKAKEREAAMKKSAKKNKKTGKAEKAEPETPPGTEGES